MLERKPRLYTRLWRAFVLQVVLISATAAAGVYLAEFAIREILIVSALEHEAKYFWSRYAITHSTPAPNTNTLIGYLFDAGSAETPAEFANLSSGIHDLTTAFGTAVVHVSAQDDKRLYLVFDANNVRQLATYFGIAPLALLLMVLYSSAWVAYGLAQKAVSPVIRLARLVRDIDLETPDLATFEAQTAAVGGDAEIQQLTHALQHLMARVDQLIERERTFTREASHELRSPLTVIRLAGDNLLARSDLEPGVRGMVERMLRAARDMEELTEVLLLLARELEGGLAVQPVDINEVVLQELARTRLVFADKELAFAVDQRARLELDSAPRLVAVVFGNLLRNACSYTERGRVDITIGEHAVVIRDSGIGMSRESLGQVFKPYFRAAHARASGHGIGLSLVKRICDRFGWEIAIESEPECGTRVEVRLPAARVRPIDPAGVSSAA